MDHFEYRHGVLHAEDVALDRIADAVGTPFYCYSTATLERHYGVFTEALGGLDATLCYSVKANGNLAVIRTLARLGAGADVVSGGELTRALAAGVPAAKIVFSGVGKTAAEIRQALDAGILQINVESDAELAAVDAVAGEMGVTAPVAFRLNPDVDADTHHKISTGRREDKFGIAWDRAHEVFIAAAGLANVTPVGLAVHIGSQLSSLEPFRAAFLRVRGVVEELRREGIDIQTLDLGGGLGVPYEDAIPPPPADYGAMVAETVGDLGLRLLFEPGRVIVGNAGVLVTRVVYVKEGATRRFVIVDAAMNDLLRPALYDARHRIVPVAEGGAPAEAVDVVGPVCETGDAFATDIELAGADAGALLAIRTAGAYGAVMASTYNARPLVPEVLVRGADFAVVRDRIGTEEYLAHEHLPAWLD